MMTAVMWRCVFNLPCAHSATYYVEHFSFNVYKRFFILVTFFSKFFCERKLHPGYAHNWLLWTQVLGFRIDDNKKVTTLSLKS